MKMDTGVKVAILAVIVSLAAGGCTTPGKRTGTGAGAGAATGAIIGGAAGGWKGAAIGAIAGAATGAAVGNYLDKQAKELEKVAETKRVKDALLVNLESDLLFPFDSAKVNEESRRQLMELGKILAKYPRDAIRVVGFTDNIGPSSYNEKLSKERAAAVQNILRKNGVKPGQTTVIGAGETHPVASNEVSSGRAKNRRVELQIYVPKERAPASEQVVEEETS